MRTRDRAYAASAAATTTMAIVPSASTTELTRAEGAYGLRPISAKLPRVNWDGTRTAYLGVGPKAGDTGNSAGAGRTRCSHRSSRRSVSGRRRPGRGSFVSPAGACRPLLPHRLQHVDEGYRRHA